MLTPNLAPYHVSFSELTAFISRSVQPGVKRGEIKNGEKLARVSGGDSWRRERVGHVKGALEMLFGHIKVIVG